MAITHYKVLVTDIGTLGLVKRDIFCSKNNCKLFDFVSTGRNCSFKSYIYKNLKFQK